MTDQSPKPQRVGNRCASHAPRTDCCDAATPPRPGDGRSKAGQCVGNGGRTGASQTADAIAQAVATERERCAGIAAAEAEKRFENAAGYPAARVHDFMVVARSIEREINASQASREKETGQ